MLGNSFVALLFVLMVIVIVFLGFQVQENSSKCKEARTSHQTDLKEAARLMLQADSQANPFWKYRHALEAKLRLELLLQSYGSLTAASKSLKTDGKRLETLRKNMDEQIEVSEAIMAELASKYESRFDNEFNKEAGLSR
jgi:hypothetical protein